MVRVNRESRQLFNLGDLKGWLGEDHDEVESANVKLNEIATEDWGSGDNRTAWN